MRKSLTLLMTAAALSLAGTPAYAHGPGFVRFSHGMAAPDFNEHALRNSNGRFAADRETGLLRAEERMSTRANARRQAQEARARLNREPAPIVMVPARMP